VPGDGQVHQLAGPGDDVPAALAALAALAAPEARAVPQPAQRPQLPGSAGGVAAEEALTAENAAAVIGALLPEGAIVSDEANTSGLWLPAATAGAPPHDWLTLTGGAIGQGLPVATGAAAACPDRPVLALEADGSAMYTISSLWTHAREGLDVTTVIFSNRAYAILNLELQRVGAVGPGAGAGAGTGVGAGNGSQAGAGPAARSLLDLSRPDIDFTALAAGMGVPASRASTTGEFAGQLRRALAEPGPHLIEAIVPPVA
jgi:acetolactate synthase-1/2/3 large subunit